jgi:alanine racemase
MTRGPTVEINLANLAANISQIKKRVNNRSVFAVVKADAYGHGAVEVSKILARNSVESLAVAFISEAVELRESGINSPILVFFDTEITEDLLKYRLVPVINSVDSAKRLSMMAERHNRELEVHINIDTGMGRLGIRFDEADKVLSEIAPLKNIKIAGLMSHLSDTDFSDRQFSDLQIERFERVRRRFYSMGLTPICHLANSAAIASIPETFFDAVRPGLMIYGCNPYSPDSKRPVMSVKTRLLTVRKVSKGATISYGRTFITKRESIIGILPLGYADGMMRSLSNNTSVIVRGRRVPVIGRVCMDLTIVDLTDIEDVDESDEVVILGSQGEESISVEEIAENAGTIPYEILTSLGSRNRRVYITDESS